MKNTTKKQGYTIGNEPTNAKRLGMLTKLQAAGYRGIVSVTAYYAADLYTLDDDGVHFDGRYGYNQKQWVKPNYGQLMKQYIYEPKTTAKAPHAARRFNNINKKMLIAEEQDGNTLQSIITRYKDLKRHNQINAKAMS